jgi:uncharacterized protein YjdB
MAYDTRTLTHGSKNIMYSTDTGVVTATGVKAFPISTEQESKDYYADGQIHMTLYSPSKVTVKQVNYQISPVEHVQAGEEVVAGGGFSSTGLYPVFNLQREITVHSDKGDTLQLDVLYGVTSSTWGESDDEDEDTINPKTYTRTLTSKGLDMMINGEVKNIKHMTILRTEANAAVFDTHNSKILMPADFDSSIVSVDSVSVTPSTLSIKVGETADFTYNVLPTNASNQQVTLQGTDSTVATYVDNAGKVTVTGLKAGTDTINLTSVDGAKTASVVITVTAE